MSGVGTAIIADVPSPTVAVLLHSPFLGPASLRPLAEALGARQQAALVPDLWGTVVATPVHQRLLGEFSDAIAELDPDRPLLLVGHSGAGPLLPAFADVPDSPVLGLVYLDAGLPTPGQSWRETAPAQYEDLRSRSRGGRLPQWHRWFDPDPIAELVTDLRLRAALLDEQPEVPVAFLKEPRPVVTWPGPAGYLQLSEPYATDADTAEGLGWPVRRLDRHHLAVSTDPAPVADALLDLFAALPS